jgi:hypothetical protein
MEPLQKRARMQKTKDKAVEKFEGIMNSSTLLAMRTDNFAQLVALSSRKTR